MAAMKLADRSMMAKLACEFVGTLALIYVGVMVLNLAPGNLTAAALAHGLTIAVMASATMAISGGHLNPAVTVGIWAAKRIPGAEAASYILAQLAGGATGALLAKLTLPPGLEVATGLPSVHLVGPGTALFIEAILTFFLVFVVFGTGVDSRFGGRIGALAIGLTVTLDIYAGGPLTGAAMNPARWFGPALVAGDWQNALVWIVGPLFGAVVAGALWSGLILPKVAKLPLEPAP